MRGRLGFARAQLFGKIGGPALRLLTLFSDGVDDGIEFREVLLTALGMLCELLVAARPRQIPVSFASPLVLFTDGACEPVGDGLLVTIGAVLIGKSKDLIL